MEEEEFSLPLTSTQELLNLEERLKEQSNRRNLVSWILFTQYFYLGSVYWRHAYSLYSARDANSIITHTVTAVRVLPSAGGRAGRPCSAAPLACLAYTLESLAVQLAKVEPKPEVYHPWESVWTAVSSSKDGHKGYVTSVEETNRVQDLFEIETAIKYNVESKKKASFGPTLVNVVSKSNPNSSLKPNDIVIICFISVIHYRIHTQLLNMLFSITTAILPSILQDIKRKLTKLTSPFVVIVATWFLTRSYNSKFSSIYSTLLPWFSLLTLWIGS